MKDNIESLNPSLITIFQALSDQIRLNVLGCLLRNGNKTLSVQDYDIAKSTFSHHIKILKDANLIKIDKVGCTNIYSLNRDFIENEYPGLIQLLELKIDQVKDH